MSKFKLIRKLNLPSHEKRSLIQGAGLAVGGALVAYLSTVISEVDLGTYSYILVPLATILLDIAKKVLTNDPE